jgi:hypothetical protein
MKHQRRGWLIVIIVFLVGVVGLLPIKRTQAATIKLSGDLNAVLSYLSPDQRWVVFKALAPESSTDYKLYTIDLTEKSYDLIPLSIPPIQVNDAIEFSASGRYLLISRTFSGNAQWELYVHDFETGTHYFVTQGQDRIGATFTPNESHILLQPGYGQVLYSIPITGGKATRLTPLDFPLGSDYYHFYEPSPDGTHVIMRVEAFTNTVDGYIGYAPLTETGTTIWRGSGEQPGSVLFSADGSSVYVGTNTHTGTSRLLRLTLPKGNTTLLLDGLYVSLIRGDSNYGFVRYIANDGQRMWHRLTYTTGEVVPLFTTESTIQRAVYHEGTRNMVIGTRLGTQNRVYGLNYEIPTTATALLTVSEPSPYFNEYIFTPDGSAVIVGEALNINDVHLYRVEPDGTVPPLLLLGGTPVDDSFEPSRDNLAVLGVVQEGEQARLQYIPLNNDLPYTVFVAPPTDELTIRHVLANDQVIVRTRTVEGEGAFYLTDVRPTVTFATGQIEVDEGSQTVLTITFVPSTTFTTTLSLELTGTATTDIQIEPMTVSVPPSTAMSTLTIWGLLDAEPESVETAILTLLPSHAVVLGTPRTVTLTVIDQTKRLYAPFIIVAE